MHFLLHSVRKEGCETRPMLEGFFLVPFKFFGFTKSHFMKSLSRTDEPLGWEVRISGFDETVGGRPVSCLGFNLKRMGKGRRNWYPIWGFWVLHGILFMFLNQCEGGGVGCQNFGSSVTSCIWAGKHLTLRCKSFNHAESVVTKSCEPLGARNSQHDVIMHFTAWTSDLQSAGQGKSKAGNLYSPKVSA